MSLYECSGVIRNMEAEVTILWQCQNCGREVEGGLYRPDIPCPYCGAQNEESEKEVKEKR